MANVLSRLQVACTFVENLSSAPLLPSPATRKVASAVDNYWNLSAAYCVDPLVQANYSLTFN